MDSGGPSIVLITGKDKPFKTVLSKADYADVRRLGDEYKARVPRSVLVVKLRPTRPYDGRSGASCVASLARAPTPACSRARWRP